jgi:predicted neutral ceramidase superfamily lipid hydrolase
VGETVETLIGALVIEGKQRFAFFIPCVHFGPFGDLGGSDLPARVCDALPNSLVLHGTVTHDMNPVSRQEASKVVSTCKELFDSPVENKNFYFTKGEHGFAHSIALHFDGKKKEGLFILSRAPKTTEDIHFGLGMAIRNLAMQKLDEAIIVDAHNAETGEFTTFEPSSVEGFEYIDAVADSLKEKKADGCYFGFAKTEFNDSSLGGAGIRAAVFGNEREKFGLIVFDSNGVEPSLREMLVSHVKTKLGIDCEILTTDQHKSNVVGGVRNPISGEGVVEVAVECLAQAIKNMGKVKVGLMVKRIKIKAFGPRNSITVIGTVNSIVAILKILAPFILLFALALALFGVMPH